MRRGEGVRTSMVGGREELAVFEVFMFRLGYRVNPQVGFISSISDASPVT